MAEKAVRKTTTKRAVKKTTTKVAVRKSAPKRVASRSVRKAPSTIVRPSKKSVSKVGIGFIVVCLLVAGTGVGIGYTDAGQIDVSSVITVRKQNASTPQEQEAMRTVPVQQSKPTVPNGGLVGTGKSQGTAPQPAVEAASSTAETESTTGETDPAEDEQEEVADVSSESSDTPEETQAGEEPTEEPPTS